jgi:heme iron utilization protein
MTKPDLAETPADPAASARQVMRQTLTAVMSTLDKNGAPFASLVQVAFDADASPLLLMSTLASHTRNAERDPRVSLLFDGTRSLDLPMTGPRLTVSGKLARTGNARHRARFLRRHEDAALYADFGDFGFFQLQCDVAHLVSGFGMVSRLAGRDLLRPCPCLEDLETREAEVVSHMNNDHSEALDKMAGHFCAVDSTGWQMTGLDEEGLDLRLGGTAARIEFPEKLANMDQARTFLIELAKTSQNTE